MYGSTTVSLTENSTGVATTNSISRKKRILIVDDDMDIANLYKLSLEDEGFVVNAFNDPLLALSNYRAETYEMLLLDVKMPQMSGFELYQKVKQIDDKVKVCFITAFEEYHSEFKKLFPKSREPDCVIMKPIELRNLTKIVKSQLDHN
ncbi:MAG: response regulator [Candidatus Nitrosopolaris sp.]